MSRAIIILIIVAIVLMVGGMVLLGIPGAVFATLAEPPVAIAKGVPIGSLIEGDRAWPAAILLTLVVPPAIPLSFWTATVIWQNANGWLLALATIAGTYLWSVIVLFALAS